MTCGSARNHSAWRARGVQSARLALVTGLALACGHAPTPSAHSPEATLTAFARALEQGEPARAYALMSREYRTRVSLERFQLALEQHPQETLELGATLEKRSEPIRQEARARLATGSEVRLLREGYQWFVADDVVDFYAQATPRDALRSFVRALRARRYDVVLGFAPEAERDGLTPELLAQGWAGEAQKDLERVLGALEQALGSPIEQVGARATLHYGGGLRAQLVREGETWKVVTLH